MSAGYSGPTLTGKVVFQFERQKLAESIGRYLNSLGGKTTQPLTFLMARGLANDIADAIIQDQAQ